MKTCDDTTGIVITPPKDPTLAERLGLEEIELSKTDANGDVVTAYVFGRVERSNNG